jgi:hypothetical protein
MPLSKIQSDVLLAIAKNRNPESFIAGATPINKDGPRYSSDIDIFHDREENVAASAIADVAVLEQSGFTFEWLRREPGFYSGVAAYEGDATKLEWARDNDFRFFPATPDETFGFRLHAFDLATNKALAAGSRREPRDVLDLILIDARVIPLGAVIWAAVAKDPGYSPESLIAEIRRNARYRADDFTDLRTTSPVDAGEVARALKLALEKADEFVGAMPIGKEGLAFLRNGAPVQPDPGRLNLFVEHEGRRRGHWPSSAEIGGAMLDNFRQGDF